MPRADADLGPWATKLAAGCAAHATVLGFTTPETTALTTAAENWNDAYPAHLAAQTAANTAKATKDAARVTFETLARAANAKVQAKTGVNADLKTELGLPVYDDTPTRVAVPTSRPTLDVDSSQRLQHTLRYRDEATPTSRAKPAGVAACEVWLFIGTTAPAGPDAMHLQAVDKSTPYLMEFDSADAGKTAWWALRWVNTKGEHGPWSATVSATIPG